MEGGDYVTTLLFPWRASPIVHPGPTIHLPATKVQPAVVGSRSHVGVVGDRSRHGVARAREAEKKCRPHARHMARDGGPRPACALCSCWLMSGARSPRSASGMEKMRCDARGAGFCAARGQGLTWSVCSTGKILTTSGARTSLDVAEDSWLYQRVAWAGSWWFAIGIRARAKTG